MESFEDVLGHGEDLSPGVDGDKDPAEQHQDEDSIDLKQSQTHSGRCT